MPDIRVMLVEDEPLWVEGIRVLLTTLPGFTLAGVADNYEEALQTFEQVSPQVVLLDWKIKGTKDGLAVGAALEEKGFPAGSIILVSGSEASLIPKNGYHYVPKSQMANQLIPTLQRVTNH